MAKLRSPNSYPQKSAKKKAETARARMHLPNAMRLDPRLPPPDPEPAEPLPPGPGPDEPEMDDPDLIDPQRDPLPM